MTHAGSAPSSHLLKCKKERLEQLVQERSTYAVFEKRRLAVPKPFMNTSRQAAQDMLIIRSPDQVQMTL